MSIKNLACRSGVAAALLAAATTASAATPVQLYGGGATLPANAYVGNLWLTYNPAHRLSNTLPGDPNPASTDSAFASMATNASAPAYVQYCQTGSGTGRGVITGAKPDATSACGDYSGPTPNGFSAGTARANFSGSDAPFSASDVSTFATNNSAYGSPVQIPAVGGAIAVVYNNTDVASRLNLSETQICRIFAGEITNWKTINSKLPSKPITLVVRSDNSGTTFSFMNHLSAVCPTAQPKQVAGFTTQSVFATGAVGGVLPAGTIASSGNGGVIASVVATDGAIGYAEASDTKSRQEVAGASGINWATIQKRPDIPAVLDEFGNVVTPAQKFKKFDPFLNTRQYTRINPMSDKVIGGNDANGRPIVVDQAPVLPAAAGCIQLVDPSDYAVPTLTAKGDYTGYPIIAVSYLMGYYQSNEAGKTPALRQLFKTFYSYPTGKVKTIGTGTGFSWLTTASTLDSTAMARINYATTTPMKALIESCLKP